MDDVMDSINESCESIINSMKNIEENQLKFHKIMMEMIKILEERYNKK